MSTPELIGLILQGGAVVVLFLWVLDLRDQRKQERSERLENNALMRDMTQAVGGLTDSIDALLEGRPPRPPRTRR